MAQNQIWVPKKQLASLDRVMRENFYKATCYDCLYPDCKNKAINSHTVPENMLYKVDPDLKKILYFMSGFIEEQKIEEHTMDIGRLFKPIHAARFSTFPGFCPTHDYELFKEIDNFDGVMSKKKAVLIHYRNICYGIANIRAMIAQEKHFREHYLSEPIDCKIPFWKLLKDERFAKKLQYCLEAHIQRKIIMDEMLSNGKYERVSFQKFPANINNPVFSGRAGRTLNPQEGVYKTHGYNIMPWVTYITLIDGYQNFLVFCWLEIDKKYAKKITGMTRITDSNRLEFRKIVERIAYCESDAIAMHEDFYKKNKNIIDSIIKSYTEGLGRHR